MACTTAEVAFVRSRSEKPAAIANASRSALSENLVPMLKSSVSRTCPRGALRP
jgi:hypothetical protein